MTASGPPWRGNAPALDQREEVLFLLRLWQPSTYPVKYAGRVAQQAGRRIARARERPFDRLEYLLRGLVIRHQEFRPLLGHDGLSSQ